MRSARRHPLLRPVRGRAGRGRAGRAGRSIGRREGGRRGQPLVVLPLTPPLQLRFALSAPGIAGLPDSRAEVAFVGRSNVGKSSLLNALANRKALAHTSK